MVLLLLLLLPSQVFAGHEGSVTCGLFTPDGRAVVTGGADATVRVWAPKKGTCRHVFQVETSCVMCGHQTKTIQTTTTKHDRPFFCMPSYMYEYDG
jgi:WD40 repeat protein